MLPAITASPGVVVLLGLLDNGLPRLGFLIKRNLGIMRRGLVLYKDEDS